MTALEFEDNGLDSCPPMDVIAYKGTIYRKVDKFPAAATDFDSDISRKAKNADPIKCECWGCSVWCTTEDVEAALKLFPYWTKRYIVAVEVDVTDGRIKNTKSGKQVGHMTLWKALGIDLSSRCTVHRAPTHSPAEAGA